MCSYTYKNALNTFFYLHVYIFHSRSLRTETGALLTILSPAPGTVADHGDTHSLLD